MRPRATPPLQKAPRAADTGGVEITIRSAGLHDLERLLALEVASFDTDRVSRRSMRRLLDSPSAALLVAESGDQLAGAATVLFRRNTRMARLYSLAVHAQHRGCGVAGRLCAAVEHVARLRGCEHLTLEVRADNAAALALYRREGFRRFGVHAAYYGDGADALRLRKWIAHPDAGVAEDALRT